MKRDKTLDIARSLSMLYIIGIWHLANYTTMYTIPYGEYITYSVLGLFMFISGFLLKGKYQIVDFTSAFQFFKKRVIRILPLFFLAVSFYLFSESISWKTALLTLGGLSTLVPPQMGTLWFVSMIILFYMIYPLLWSKKREYTILIAVLLWGMCYWINTIWNNIDIRFFYYFPCFVMGMLVMKTDLCKMITSLKVILVASLVLGITCILLTKMELSDLFVVLCIIFVSLSGLLLILGCSYRIAKYINYYVVECIAYASMAAYMFHRQIWSIIRRVYWPEDGSFRLLFLVVVCLPIILIMGYCIQYAYDKLVLYITNYGNSLHRK